MSHSGLGVRARRSQNVKMRGSRYLPVDPRFEPLHRQIRFPIWVRVLSSSRSEAQRRDWWLSYLADWL